MMNKTLLSVLSALLLSLVLSSCGFRLKGDYQLPPSLLTLKLQSPDNYGELSRLVKSKLARYQVTVADSTDTDLPILFLSKDKLERGTLSLFSTGQVAEYELTYSVDYLLTLPNQEPQRFNVTIRRDYLDDPQSAQAKSRERAQLLREIRAEAAQIIVYQLSQIKPK
ncbi:LPS assembly lipoprotein LptE [Psychrobium sp. 1_MG-2023]|uniref:LPS-assembly lipoprotein LptE n=1 Tax=Psychrobium sp. 1_MG-2023 TaxID=3062624 RepID=UPI000C33DE88|nr:LPS assembly lipoprotein LptE [Psychrobium sp. 1_MG-2023]MDP2560591.1 LPS assembly lipoprotein LptE [Psychrobium sp. 1_MG-2023]PKF57577.1 hypothetical protein CW748_06735 [Alteromonadales bacterium alter-6D02]